MESNKHIGDKTSFWKLLRGINNKNILIPTIQRDYTYGSETEQTDKVLNKMLNDIKTALFNSEKPELSMNFIYGYTENEVNYVPLDGQQRLTTLYLIHYYAALYDDKADFNTLMKFTYSTRESTRNYCKSIIENHEDIINDLDNNHHIDEIIANMPWFYPDFNYDPSIRSMQVVLKRIQEKFDDVKTLLWHYLTLDSCRVNFYLLDFGPFKLSDELYVKMNARGKKLTEYEIFKSMFLKQIEIGFKEKEIRSRIANKFDNDWTDLIWGFFGSIENLKIIDEAFISLLHLLFRLLSGLKNNTEYSEKPKLDYYSICYYTDNISDIYFIEDFIDTFYDICKGHNQKLEGIIRSEIRNIIGNDIKQYVKDINVFYRCIIGLNVTNGELLILYGQYLAFKALSGHKKNIEDIRLRMRHLRNIIENSNDEIRASNMKLLLKGVECVINGTMVKDIPYKFNKNQWNEECEKENHIENWKKLWVYEEHPILRGALSSFWDDQKPDLANEDILNHVISRLDKFSHIFTTAKINISHDQIYYNEQDKLLRAAFLTVKDFSQSPKNKPGYKIIGNMSTCWRLMFVKSEQRLNQRAIIDVIDSLDIEGDNFNKFQHIIDDYINDTEANTRDWRFYAVKYKEYAYESNTYSNRYGYFYDYSVEDTKETNSLRIAMLQSTQFGTSNRAWLLLPYILLKRNKCKYNLFMGDHAANEEESNIRFSLNSKECTLNICCDGWYIYGMSLSQAEDLGIPCEEKVEEGGNYLLCTPAEHDDYITWAENNIFKKLEVIPDFNIKN